MTGGALRVGLDVGGTKVLGILLDGDAVRHTVRLRTRPGTEGVVDTAAAAVQDLCAAHGVRPADLAGVGLGLPGIVEPRAGTVSHAVNLRMDLPAVPIGPLLSARLGGVPVTVENDLNAATLGAADLLGLRDMALLALGTGVAAGLVLDGRLRRGHAGAAGEIGHLPYRPGGPVCACGQRGCLELYASGSALDAAWTSSGGTRPDGALPGGTPSGGIPAGGAWPAQEVFAAAAAGDAVAVAVRTAFADAVATAVRFLVLTCDVTHIVLGGGVAQVGLPLRDAVADAIARQTAGSPFLGSLAIADRLAVAPAGVPVGAIGAALATRGDDVPGRLVRSGAVVLAAAPGDQG